MEIIELIWQKLGAAKTREAITLLPWARAIRQLEAIPNTVLFGMGYSPERATKFFWVGPYYTHVLSLIAPKRLGLKLRSLAHAKPFRIGVVREDIGHKTLVSKGFSPDRLDLSRDIDELHRKFIRNRFDLICYTRNSYFTYLATRAEDAEWLEEVFTVSEAKSGFGFNRGIPADLIHRFQEALDQLIKEGAVARILKAYDLK